MSLILFCDVQQLLQDCSALEVKAVNFYLVKKKIKMLLTSRYKPCKIGAFLGQRPKAFFLQSLKSMSGF